MQTEERPGTSFTSKRQIKSQQRLLNVGILESEDPTARLRPETQNVSTHKRFQKPVIKDKEQMHEEIIALKLQLTALRKENAKLKIRVTNQEKDIRKAVRVDGRNEMEIYYNEQQTPSQKCMVELRRQVREKDEELEKKEQQIQMMKKTQKFLQQREMEAEIEELKQETLRLRQLLDRLPRSSSVVSTLQQDNVELTTLVEHFKGELDLMGLQLKETDSKYKKLLHERNGLKRVIVQMGKEIEETKKSKHQEQKQKQNEHQEQELKQELEKKFNECNQLNNGIRLKEKKIQELEDQMKQVQNNYIEKIDDLEREKIILKNQLISLREEMQQQQQQYGKRKTTQYQSAIQIQNIQQMTSIGEIQDDEEEEYVIEKKQVVQKLDVQDIGTILKYKLLLYKLLIEDLDNYLFFDCENDQVTIFQVKDNVMNYPFELNEKQAELLARYLIEDNTESSIMFNGDLSASIPRVRSIFKTLVGKYHLQDDVSQQVQEYLNKNHITLLDNITRLKGNQHNPQQEGYLLLNEFNDIFSDLSKVQQDHMLANNYQKTKDINLVDYQHLFQYYSQTPTLKDNQDYE